MSTDFLSGKDFISWSSERTSLSCEGVVIGEGSSAIEVLVAKSNGQPTKNQLTSLYTERRGGRPSPVLVVALYNNTADLCGPSGENPSVYRGNDQDLVENICESALNEPDRNAAIRFLTDTLERLGDELPGIANRGLLSTHELKTGVPDRNDWSSAREKAALAVGKKGEELLDELGYKLERTDSGPTYILRDKNKATAVAVLLHEGESFTQPQDRFSDNSPITYAINKADDENLGYVIANYDSQLRLYSTDKDAGFGPGGRTDTYVQANLNLLPENDLGYLWLLFSAEALRDGGSLEDIMERSKDYAAGLRGRLRERVYDDVVPTLAKSIAGARDIEEPNRRELDETYQMALVLLYRLLFIAYAEDKRFLPYKRNSRYTDRSLKKKAHELHELVEEGVPFDPNSTTHWEDVNGLVEAIHNGNKEWGVPEYNGKLLSSNEKISPEGAKLAKIELSNKDFGPALQNLLIDKTSDGYEGPVDFRNIGVRDFGTIYEGLLESELSVADQPLKLDENDVYVPADEAEGAEVEEGEVYLHGESGERKSTGSYYTKDIFVSHLLDHSLEPALEEHINKLNQMSNREAEEEFFKFRVADIAMGSGHFLVSVVDRIESRFNKYLTERPLPGIAEELDNLQEVAANQHETQDTVPEIDRSKLLRRQIARRCIYGVDINPLATELARLSVWIHTFVPGLPLAFLDHNLVTGDSLAGIATFDEAKELLSVSAEEDDLSSGAEDINDLWSAKSESTSAEVRSQIDKIGELTDADAKEVKLARKTQNRLMNSFNSIRALFDVMASSRIDEDIDPARVMSSKDIKDIPTSKAYKKSKETLKNVNPLHFPSTFPEVFRDKSGFDVVVGNPPWEEAMLDEDNFWRRYQPGLKGKTQTEKEKIIEQLKDERTDLKRKYRDELEETEKRRKILANGPYPGMGKGDPDLYKAFYWRFLKLVKQEGHVGVVLPRSAFMAAGSEVFRRKLLNENVINDLTFLKNKKGWVFEHAEHRYTIALVSYSKKEPAENSTLPIKGPYPNERSFNKGQSNDPHTFPVEEALNWTDSAAFPLLPSNPTTVEVFKIMSDHSPLSLDEEERWRARPHTELHATNDKKKDDGTVIMHLSEKPPEESFWRVFKGNSFNIWDNDTGVTYAWADPDVVLDYLQEKRENSFVYAGSRSAFGEMPEDWIYNQETLPCFHPRVAFRNVTNRTNRRTIISALIPPEVILTNAAPYFIWPRGDEKDQAYLLGVLSSIPLDWYARRFVETNVNYHILNSFPIPRQGNGSELKQKVVELSGQLATRDDRFEDWAQAVGVECGPLGDTEKQEKIYELDAVVSHLYGLSREHVKVIFETFHRGWDYQERLDNVLKYYDEWEKML